MATDTHWISGKRVYDNYYYNYYNITNIIIGVPSCLIYNHIKLAKESLKFNMMMHTHRDTVKYTMTQTKNTITNTMTHIRGT